MVPDGKHVMSIEAQFAPYKLKAGDWNSRREDFADAVIRQLEEYAPGIRDLIVAKQVLTPRISSKPMASAAATFITASKRLISSLRSDRYLVGRSIELHFNVSICVAQEPIRAEA